MSLNGVEYNVFSLNLLLEDGDLLLKFALSLSVETVVAGLLALQTAVQVLDVELSFNIELVDQLLQSLNVLIGLFTFLSVVVLLLGDVKGQFFQFNLQFALFVEEDLVFASGGLVFFQLLFEFAVSQVVELFTDVANAGYEVVLVFSDGLVVACAVRVISKLATEVVCADFQFVGDFVDLLFSG